jgi:hypothetical protein
VRLFPVLCGVGLIVGLYIHLRRRASPLGVLCAVSLLAIQADLVSLSRLATPEIVSMLGGLLTWIVIDAARGRRFALFGAGCVLAGALAFKLTSYYLIPAFALVVFWQRKGEGMKTRLVDTASLLTGLAVPGLVVLIAIASRLQPIDELMTQIMVLAQFLERSTFYTMAARPFEARGAPVMNSAMLTVWLGLIALMAAWTKSVPAEPKGTQRRLEASLIFAGTWIFVMENQSYFPERYMVHVLVPLSLVAAFALSRLETIGLVDLTSAFASLHGLRKAVAVSILSGPAIVVTAPIVAVGLAVLGAPTERLTTKLLALVLASPPILAAVNRCWGQPRAMGVIIAFPLVTTLGWLMTWAWSEIGIAFWPDEAFVKHGLLWSVGLGVAFAVTWACVGAAMRSSWEPFKVGGVAASLAWACAWLGLLLPGFINPQYHLRAASQDLARRLPNDAEIHQFRAGGLFLGNSLDSSRVDFDTLATDLPEYVVIHIPLEYDLRVLDERYDLIASYNLPVSSHYEWFKEIPATHVCGPVRGYCVVVYARR